MTKNYPVFICGALRSGSTLLHLMLDHHPNIKNPGEFDFMFDYIGQPDRLPEVGEYAEALKTDRIFRSHNLNIDSALDYKALINSFVDQLRQKNSDIIAMNVHRNFEAIPRVFSDKAKYIHLLRDPRDVAVSSIQMGWHGNVYYGVEHWIDTENSWDKLISQLKPEQFTTLHYEKLVAEPEAELSRLCDFLGLPYDHSMLDYPNTSTYAKPDKSLAQQWKRKLDQRAIQHVEAKGGDLMVARGYELSGHPIRPPSFPEKVLLALGNKLFRLKFNINRYGLMDFLSEKITRLLGLKSLNEKFLLKLQEIDTKHLK